MKRQFKHAVWKLSDLLRRWSHTGPCPNCEGKGRVDHFGENPSQIPYVYFRCGDCGCMYCGSEADSFRPPEDILADRADEEALLVRATAKAGTTV